MQGDRIYGGAYAKVSNIIKHFNPCNVSGSYLDLISEKNKEETLFITGERNIYVSSTATTSNTSYHHPTPAFSGRWHETCSKRRLGVPGRGTPLNTQKAQLRNLQMQIKPHFLINSLNMIYNLIGTDQIALARELIQYLVNYFHFMMKIDQDVYR